MAEKKMVLKVLLQVRNPTWRPFPLWVLRRARFKATCAPERGRFSIQCSAGCPREGLRLLTAGRAPLPVPPHTLAHELGWALLSRGAGGPARCNKHQESLPCQKSHLVFPSPFPWCSKTHSSLKIFPRIIKTQVFSRSYKSGKTGGVFIKRSLISKHIIYDWGADLQLCLVCDPCGEAHLASDNWPLFSKQALTLLPLSVPLSASGSNLPSGPPCSLPPSLTEMFPV